jgi:competence protein ComEC
LPLIVVAIVMGACGFASFRLQRWYKRTLPPPPTAGELAIHVLPVGQGDAILIHLSTGKTALIDCGDKAHAQVVLDALKRDNVTHLDYFITSLPRPDHIGAAAAVLDAVKTDVVIESGIAPPTRAQLNAADNPAGPPAKPGKIRPSTTRASTPGLREFPTVLAYQELKDAAQRTGAKLQTAEPGLIVDLGGGAHLTVLAPVRPYFTRERIISTGGNMLNANSLMLRLDYGEFSMLLPGDADAVTETSLLAKGTLRPVNILKVAHHGSRYATTMDFLKRIAPEVAIISTAANNRYGHPAKEMLDRLREAKVRLFRTDLQGEIIIKTNGVTPQAGKLYEISAQQQPKTDIWLGREGDKDDSERSGFISYGDYDPPVRKKK